MVNSPNDLSQLASDAVLYNPSDLTSWVNSLLSEDEVSPGGTGLRAQGRWDKVSPELLSDFIFLEPVRHPETFFA
ncbi:hypothetical protein ACE6H2_003911 [Prunus campanulata]